MNKTFTVYILTNHTNTVFYVGVTNNLERRIFEHKMKIDSTSFASKYNLYKLVWFEHFPTPGEAIAVEKKIKGWRREKKLGLVRQKNPSFATLDPSTRSCSLRMTK